MFYSSNFNLELTMLEQYGPCLNLQVYHFPNFRYFVIKISYSIFPKYLKWLSKGAMYAV